MILLFLCCIQSKKTSLEGIIDLIDNDNCLVEFKDIGAVEFSSQFCKTAKEGDEVVFYVKARAK